MNILEVIKKRRSVRKFQDREIPKDLVDKLIEALIWAPSAGNLQSRKFYFIRNQGLKDGLVEAAWGQSFIAKAPLVIAACADMRIRTHYGSRGTDLYALQDVAASVQNLMLLACEHGIATAWVGAFDEDSAARVLELPQHLRPVVIVPVGYPAEKPRTPERVHTDKAVVFVD
ncbi:MAG: nitroreductase family protein [Candidatus Brocadiales bacterium]|nr:nitroreductase family protein [Candidatus Bathyanammoxibius amoris]